MAKEKQRYYDRKNKGLCVICGKRKPEDGKTRCLECASKERDRRIQSRKFYLGINICPICKKRKIEPNKKMCYECAGKRQDEYYEKCIKEKKKLANREYKTRIAKERRENGVCYRCGKHKVADGGLCQYCKAKQKRYRDAVRKDIPRSEWTSYGRCYCCGKQEQYDGHKVCKDCYEKRLKTIPSMLENANSEYFRSLNDLSYKIHMSKEREKNV